ncbi:MAG: C39 family peptidase [Desulfobacteraceae bacterium]|nr:C39 family peptidase [Desulfobacteraceae bacterium]
MKTDLNLSMLSQPDDTTCGPTCLQAVYGYFGDHVGLDEIIGEVSTLDSGGTLAVYLACHALRRGYSVSIFTYNLHFFDPTWFALDSHALHAKLLAQASLKRGDPRLHAAARGYIDFLKLGGRLRFEDLSRSLIRKYLRRALPIITGLSSTYLYRSMREYGPHCQDDDLRGEPTGHFVVLSGYDREERSVLIADPYRKNPVSADHHYEVHIDRVISAILLGVLTHDANFLIIQPPRPGKKAPC